MKFETRGEISPSSDGSVTIKHTCLLPVRCAGALVLGPDSERLTEACKPTVGGAGWWGQTDLSLAAHQTETVAVPLSACARRLLARRAHVVVWVTADAGQVPACSKLPSLAQQCRTFVTAPDYTPDQGDGLNRLVSQRVTLVSAQSGS